MVMYGTRWVGGVNDGTTGATDAWQSATPVVETTGLTSSFTSGRALHISVPANGSSAPGGTATAPSSAYQRCEQYPDLSAVAGVSGGTWGPGFTGFFGLSILLDTDFPTDPRESGGGVAWQVITQFKNDGTGSPPVELKIGNGKLQLDGNSGGWSTDICPVTAGQRYNILLQLTFTESAATSTANVWVNGTQYLTNFHPTGAGFLYTGVRSYWKAGIYRETGLPTQAKASIWYGALCFDTTQATAATYLTDTTTDPDPGVTTSPLIGTLTDTFTGTTLATGWTANGAGVQNGSAYVNVSQTAGTAVFSNLRRSDSWTWTGSAIAFYNVVVPASAGDTANAQWWMGDPAPAATVDRAGWEYVAATNQLFARSQTGAGFTTTNYATLTHDPVAHRNLRLTHTGTSVLFETSPDGLTWTTQGTWATPATWTTKTTLRPSIEGNRTTGTNDTSRTGAINVPPAALATVSPTGADALQRRTLTEVRAWKSWLTANSARGWVGEFGWVTLSSKNGDTAQGAQWAALGEVYETELDVSGLSGTVWASGREWGQGYPLGVHVGVNVGDALTIANTDAATVVANHPTRGTGTGTRWRGVSLSGWEQGININGGGSVRSGAGYLHTAADFGFLAANGVDTVRLPVAWERLQPTLAAALDTTALANLDTMLLAARQVGIRIIIDLHNYGRYTQADGTTVAALGGSLTNAQFTDFWTRLSTWVRANATRSGTVIGYGLMNEVHDLTGGAATWQTASQAAVTAIRGGGDTRLLLVGGYSYSSLTGWSTNHPTGWITDSASNFVYEAHHYWDTRSALGSRSGTYQQSASGPIETYAIELAAAQAAEPATTGGTITFAGFVQTASNIPATAGGYTYGVTSFTTGSTWELLVAKTGTSDANLSITGITGGGLTWTSQVNVAGTAGTNSPVRLWTAFAPPGTAVSAIVSITNATAAARSVSTNIERFSNATLAATPATGSVVGSATPSGSITTVGTNSVVSWIDTDWNHTAGSPTMLSNATEEVPRFQPGSGATWFQAFQRVASPGAVTYGMSAPTGQKASMAAIEVQSLPVVRRNLLPNPAVAVDATGWSGNFAGSGSRVAVTGMDRPWAWQETKGSSGTSNATSPMAAVTPGAVVTGTMQWRFSVAPSSAVLQLSFYDGSGAFIGGYNTSITPSITVGAVGRSVFTAAAPANAATTHVQVNAATTAATGAVVMQVTAARIEQVNDPGLTYADGDTTNWAWDGTAGASTSSLVGQATTLDLVTETETALDVGISTGWDLDLAVETEEAVDYNQLDYALEVEQAPDVTAVGVYDLDIAVETEAPSGVPAPFGTAPFGTAPFGGDNSATTVGVTVVWVWPLDLVAETDTVTLLWYDTVLDVASEREIPPPAKQPRRPYIPGSARIKGMRVIAQQIVGGKFLDWELPVADLSITHTLSGPQAITGNLRPHLPRVAELAMTPWNTWLHCEDDDGIIRASGILVTPFGVQDDQRSLECTGVSAVPNSVPFDGSYASYSADPLDVVRMLWQHVQSYANGNLGVTVSTNTSQVRLGGYEIPTDTTTGPRVDGNTGGDSGNPYEIAWWDQTICGAEIDNLAKNVPFDYVEQQAWKADYSGVTHHVDLGWPRIGIKRTDLRFMQGENIIGAVPVAEIDDSYITDVIVTGAGEGVSMVAGRASRLRTQVRRVAFVNEKTCKSNARAKLIAEAELLRRTSPRGIDTLLIDAYHQNAPYGSFQVGDDIFVQATVDWVGDIAMWHRVMEYTYTPDESAISLKLKPSDSFRYGASV